MAAAWNLEQDKDIVELLCAIQPTVSEAHSRRGAAVHLVARLREIPFDQRVDGLSSEQLSLLIACLTLQVWKEGLNRIWEGDGRHLMAAAVLPWDFRLSLKGLDSLIPRSELNGLATDIDPLAMRTFGKRCPLGVFEYSREIPVLERTIALSVPARAHLVDVLEFVTFDGRPGALTKRTLWRTRRFGCRVEETSAELMQSGLLTTDYAAETLRRWFRKDDLKAILRKRGAQFSTRATVGELFALAELSAPTDLTDWAKIEGLFELSSDLAEEQERVRLLHTLKSASLALWAIQFVNHFRD